MRRRSKTKHGFTLTELVVCTAIAGTTFVFAAPALNKGRDGADRLRCENNLRQLSQAQLRYAAANGGLPPMALSMTNAHYQMTQPGPGGWFDGHGWYSLIGPYIGEPEWASTINLSVSLSAQQNAAMRRGGQRLKIHFCAADIGPQRMEFSSNNWARVLANYVVNAGNTNYGQTAIGDVPFLGAPFTGQVVTPLANITDGVSNTIMMSEVVILPGHLNQWGGQYSDNQSSLGGQVFTGYNPPNSSDRHDELGYGRSGAIGVTAANTRYLAAGFTAENWPISSSGQVLTVHIAPRSHHPGGVNASLCDGSAGFIANGIDHAVWNALSSARGGDFVPATLQAAGKKSPR